MKTSALFWVTATTLLLIAVVLMAIMKVPFNWIFYSTVLGNIGVLYLVYKVLTDNYTTNKTFDDFYEDNPIGQRPNV